MSFLTVDPSSTTVNIEYSVSLGTIRQLSHTGQNKINAFRLLTRSEVLCISTTLTALKFPSLGAQAYISAVTSWSTPAKLN